MSEYILDLPVSRDLARSLKLGDTVFLRGDAVITAGYPTHQRLMDCIEEGRPPPVSMDGGAFFHLGCMSRERVPRRGDDVPTPLLKVTHETPS